MTTSSKIREEESKSLLCFGGEGEEQGEIKKENPNQRQMGLLGSIFAAGEEREQVPWQTSLQPCQQQLGKHPFLPPGAPPDIISSARVRKFKKLLIFTPVLLFP